MAQPGSRKLSNFSFPSFTSGSHSPPLLFSTFPHCFQIFSNRRRVHQKAVRGAWSGVSVGGVVQMRAVPFRTYGSSTVYGVPQLHSCSVVLSSACYGLAQVMCDRRKPHPAMPSSLLPLPQRFLKEQKYNKYSSIVTSHKWKIKLLANPLRERISPANPL